MQRLEQRLGAPTFEALPSKLRANCAQTEPTTLSSAHSVPIPSPVRHIPESPTGLCPAGFTFEGGPQIITQAAAATETLQPGDHYDHYGYDIHWSADHIRGSALEPLRRLGDDLADSAVMALRLKPGQDAYEALIAYTSLPESEQESPAPRLFLEHVMAVPQWVDWGKVQRGQRTHWKYFPFIAIALLYHSVAGGLSLSRLTKVLTSTGYLIGKKTRKRIFETLQFVLDVTHSIDYLQPGTGVAWKSIIQVRLLHAGVRCRLTRISRAHSKIYSVEECGVPINQEDLLGTLFSFSTSLCWVMERQMGVNVPERERDEQLHLWRYIGHMIGVDDILGATRTPKAANASLESIVMHLSNPNESSGRMCAALLQNMDPPGPLFSIPGLPHLYKLHMALAERHFGPRQWAKSELAPSSSFYKGLVSLIVGAIHCDLWLVSRSSMWFSIRSSVMEVGLSAWINSNVGKRKLQYQLREVPKDTAQNISLSSGTKTRSVHRKYISIRNNISHRGVGELCWSKAIAASLTAMGIGLISMLLSIEGKASGWPFASIAHTFL